MAMIDYGAVVFKNGVQLNKGKFFMDMKESVGWEDRQADKFLAYVGDEHFTAMVYKTWCAICVDKKQVLSLYGAALEEGNTSHKVFRANVGGVDICIRQVDRCVLWMKFSYHGDHYNIVYGYGIDPTPRVWHTCKERYLGKTVAKKVDAIYKKITKGGRL